jgi:hypothetical protein
MKCRSPLCLVLLVSALTAVAPTPVGAWASASTRAPARVAPRAAVVCVVPDVINLPLGMAKSKLRQAHCQLGHVTRKQMPGYATHVIAQSPAPNTQLPRGGAVAITLAVSNGTGCARGYHATPYGCAPNY